MCESSGSVILIAVTIARPRVANPEPTGRDVAGTTGPATPAAAVAVIRIGVDGPEVLLVRRRQDTAFGGAWAFPGGAVEPGDRAGDARLGGAAARAAARELAEETGLVAAPEELEPLVGPIVTVDRERRFTVRFFAWWADGAAVVRLNAAELTAHQWVTPADALRRLAAGSLRLPPATRAALTAVAGRLDALSGNAPRPGTDGSGGRLG